MWREAKAMRKQRTFVTVAVAALAAAAFVVAAPSLFAKGGSGGTGGGGGKSAAGGGAPTGDSGDAPPPPDPSSSVGSNGTGSTAGKKPDNRVDLPEFRRDGEEQREIARDVLDAMARNRFRELRDLSNRAVGEPRR
jgi:hypothetical protein